MDSLFQEFKLQSDFHNLKSSRYVKYLEYLARVQELASKSTLGNQKQANLIRTALERQLANPEITQDRRMKQLRDLIRGLLKQEEKVEPVLLKKEEVVAVIHPSRQNLVHKAVKPMKS